MGKRYKIWNREDDIRIFYENDISGYTYSGERGTFRFTPSEWISRYSIQADDVVVLSAGECNGDFFDLLDRMVINYESSGADFSNAKTDEEKLEVIESFEDERNRAASQSISPELRLALAIEMSNLLRMGDINQEDPDE